MRRRRLQYLGAAAAVIAAAGVVTAPILAIHTRSHLLPAMAPNLSTLGLEYSPGSRPNPLPAPGGVDVVGGGVGGLAAQGHRLVAVGWVGPQPASSDGPVPEPAAWWSADDGATWTRARLAGHGLLRAVVAQDGRFVAVGATSLARNATALVFTSEDGSTWKDVRVDGDDVQLFAAVAGPAGPILAGSRDQQGAGPVPYVFVPEGQGWRGAPVRPAGQPVFGQVRGGCVDRGRVVLAGEGFDDRGLSRPLIVQSVDRGATWSAELVRRGLLDTGVGSAVGCTVSGGRLTVAGNVDNGGSGGGGHRFDSVRMRKTSSSVA